MVKQGFGHYNIPQKCVEMSHEWDRFSESNRINGNCHHLWRTQFCKSWTSTRRSCWMCSTPSVERVSILNFSSVETGRASFHESTRRVPQATENMGNGQRHSSYPDEVGACEPRRREATRVSIEIVHEGAQTMGPDNARDFCINGTARVRDVSFPPRCWCGNLERVGRQHEEIMFLDASRAHCQADATSEMATEVPPEDQVTGQDFVGELLKSLCGTRNAAHNLERKWQSLRIEMNFEIGTWSPAIASCRERDVCGFVHGNHFILENQFSGVEGISAQREADSQKKSILGPDDGDDKTVTILNRLVTWVCLFESCNQIEIEADPRHREILLAQMKLAGATAESAATLTAKVQEQTPQILTKLDGDERHCSGARQRKQATYQYNNRIYVRTEWRCMEHAQTFDSFFCRSWQTGGSHFRNKDMWKCHMWTQTAITHDAYLPERERQELIFSWCQLIQR